MTRCEEPPEPLTDDELVELDASDVEDELDAAGYFECTCGDRQRLWPLFSLEELRDPDCVLHGDGH